MKPMKVTLKVTGAFTDSSSVRSAVRKERQLTYQRATKQLKAACSGLTAHSCFLFSPLCCERGFVLSAKLIKTEQLLLYLLESFAVMTLHRVGIYLMFSASDSHVPYVLIQAYIQIHFHWS